MKVLITGASGLLGRAILREFSTAGSFEAAGTAFSRAGKGLERLDLRDGIQLDSLVHRFAPEIIVHCAAERRPDISEKDHDATASLNIGATARLAKLASELGAGMIYISTDYVFDGTNPPYHTDSVPNPLNYYGQSKLEGEIAVRNALARHWILRVPMLYGPVETLRESPVTAVADILLTNRDSAIALDAWAVRYPTLTDDVAFVCRRLVEKGATDPSLSGTFHWCGDEAMTKYDMGLTIAEILGLPADNLAPDPNPVHCAPRPRDAHLDCSILEKAGLGRRSPFKPSLSRVLEKYRVKRA